LPKPSADSPYPLGPVVKGQRLLQNRRVEIETVLSAVASEQEVDYPHVVLLGESNSGRTSVLMEVARRAADENGRLIVHLQGGDDVPQGRQAFIRHFLTATVEALAATLGTKSPWYRTWSNRVYLRRTDPPTEDDLLSSALILAGDQDGTIEQTIFERDLAKLVDLARQANFSGIVFCIDDASSLTEDIRLVERLIAALDTVGSCSLLMTGFPVIAAHFDEAASPSLERCVLVLLRPFRGQHQIYTALSAPLVGAANEYLRQDNAALLRDILQLTGGNPYEVMVVGYFLWLSCELGEQETYALTPRVLDRVIPALSRSVSEGHALLDGAAAIDQLAEEHVRQAVELVALSRLTVREIVIARLLGVGKSDVRRVNSEGILQADFANEEAKVREELAELEQAGIVQVDPDTGRFRIIGGRPAAVLLKYKARARIGAEATNWPFGLDFLSTIGWALSRDAMLRTLDLLPDGTFSLGVHAVRAQGGGVGRLSPRPAIRGLANSDDIGRLVQAEIDLSPWGDDAYKRIVRLLTVDNPRIALVCTSLIYCGEQFEYMEVWEVPDAVEHIDVTQANSEVAEVWVPVVEAADLKWSGNEDGVLCGKRARKVLIAMQRFAASSAVHPLFRRWQDSRDPEVLARAIRVAEEAVAAMREAGQSDAELDGELSGMLSRLGFMYGFDESRLQEAQELLEEGLRLGRADGWVTNWNLANVLARNGELKAAEEQLSHIAGEIEEWHGQASVLVFAPGRAAEESLIWIEEEGIGPLRDLHLAIWAGVEGDDLDEMIERCRLCGDAGAEQAAEWISHTLRAAAA
jgi:hypothetical protein